MDKKSLFNNIACDYDRINNFISLYTHKFFRKKAVGLIPFEHKKIIDLCCGTGDIINLLGQKFPNAEITGVDFSAKMLNIAKEKFPNVNFIESDVLNLPIKNNSYDLCTISFGLRNTDNLQKTIEEINRVLKSGGIFFNLDLGKPNRFWNIFLKPYMKFFVPQLGKLAHGNTLPLKYFVHSNETFPNPNELKDIYERLGFEQIMRKDFLFGQISCQICKKIN